MPVAGIDVSHFQGAIDFAKVAAAGNAFVYCKALDGTHGEDATFETNRHAAIDAGLLAGAYHFFRPAQPAQDQADAFCALVGSLGSCELPPMLDIEEAYPRPGAPDTWNALAMADRVAAIKTWIVSVEGALGRRPIIYSRADYWRVMLGNCPDFTACPLWLAQYRHPRNDADVPTSPLAWPATFWQWSGAGSCDGVAGQCDLDLFMGDLSALKAMAAGV